MNNNEPQQETITPVVTFSNIPLDDDLPTGPVAYDTLPPEAFQPKEISVVDITFKRGGKVYFFDPGSLTISAGDEVIIDTARGPEYGFCAAGNHTVPEDKVVSPLRSVIRIATEADKRTRKEFKEKEPHAYEVCQQKIVDHKLDMKLVSAEYSFDGSKILFYFTADGRVDFRDLVKDLAGVFRTRIELRQIGVRDEAKMLGGLGICGRPFCCKQFLDDFQPVSIKMAKTQSLSLNPTKISGTCGRLMCCLKYEQDSYESLIKSSPKTESIVNTCDGMGTVTDINILKQTVKVRLDRDPSNVKCYNNCDICVLRNGKAKKNDPPIPTDLPPLPKPKEQKEQDTITMFDESKLSNYTAEDAEKRSAREQKRRMETRERLEQRSDRPDNRDRQEGGRGRRNSRRGSDRNRSQNRSGDPNKKPQRKPETAQQTPKEAAPKEQKENSGRSRNNRRRYYRGKKPGQGGQSEK